MTTIDTIAREIKYSRQDRDYACYVDGQYIGSRANYSDAETLCDQVAYDLIADGQCATAAELDADSDLDTIAADHAVVAPVNNSLAIPCEATGCIQDATHRIAGFAVASYNGSWCCYHYSEKIGDCDCTDDDYGDALAESAQGTYNGRTDECKRDVQGNRWIICGAPGDGPCYCDTMVHATPIPAAALLAEADAALAHCPGAFEPCGADAHPSYAPYCQRCARALDRIAVASYIQRLAEDIGLSCSFCGEAHAAADCPLRRPLVVPGPRVCGNCGGAHSIQQCDELRAALFAADTVFYAVAA